MNEIPEITEQELLYLLGVRPAPPASGPSEDPAYDPCPRCGDTDLLCDVCGGPVPDMRFPWRELRTAGWEGVKIGLLIVLGYLFCVATWAVLAPR